MSDSPFEMPITDRLNLDSFQPHELAFLVPHYLDECRRQAIEEVRLVHGRHLAEYVVEVHEHLAQRRDVIEFHPDREENGWYQETVVSLSIDEALDT